MGYSYTGSALLKTTFEVLAPLPLDNRTVVNSEKELYSIPKSSAYRGMTIANPDDGNIYMLLDPNNITNKSGWKSSGIDIITCTYDDYKKLSENTNPDYSPINPELDYLNPYSYYYIIEDDLLKGRYLTLEWGDEILAILNTKIDNAALISIKEDLINLSNLLKTDYSTSAEIESVYSKISDVYNREEIDYKISEITNISDLLETSIQEINNQLPNFVTKDQLGEDFNFVTLTEYSEFKNNISKNFESDTITTSNLIIQQSEEQSSGLSMGNEGLLLDGEKIALFKDIPNLVCLTDEDYKNLETKADDTYYFTYNEKLNNGYVDNETLEQLYYTKALVDLAIQNKIKELLDTVIAKLIARIEILESYHAEETFILDESTLDETKIS